MVIVQQGPLLAMFPSVSHVVLRERNKYMENRSREAGRGRGKRKIISCWRETNWEIKNAYIREREARASERQRRGRLTGWRWCSDSKWRKTMNKWQGKTDRFGVRRKWGGAVEMEWKREWKKKRESYRQTDREWVRQLGHALQSSTKLSISKIMKPQGGSNTH